MSFREVPKHIRRLRASVPVQRLGGTPLGVWIIKHLVSPIDRHIYRLTGGRRVSTGRPLSPMLLLTTTGRRTGKEHTTPLFYLRNDERLIICNVNRPVYHPERHGYLARYEELQEEAHRTRRSRAMGSTFVAPKKVAISKSDRIAPPIASTLHQPNGTQIPTTARTAKKNSPAAVTARKKPESGKPEDTVTWPNGPQSPPLQGQAHLSRPPNVP